MIYNSREEAVSAHCEFMQKMEDLEEEYGVSVTSDDDCVTTYYEVEYMGQDGKRKTYFG